MAVQPAKPQVLILLDRSGSMGGERWTVATSSVAGFVQSFEERVAFGLTYFPGPGEELTCLPGRNMVAPAINTASEITMALEDPAAVAVRDRGYTPTASTLRGVFETLSVFDPDRPPSASFVVLVTDGGPNCKEGAERNADPDEEGAYAAIDALADEGIQTYVVGYLTETVADVMDEMARRGGTEHHHAVANAEELRVALEDITNAIASCAFKLETAPEDPTYVRVQLDGEDLLLADGQFSIEGDLVQVLGASCGSLRDGAEHFVDITVECEPIQIF